MTASSIDLFSRQVQLIGLPPQAQQTTTATINGVTNVNVVLRPSLENVRRVSRNLFGGPRSGEIEEMLQKETQSQKEYFMRRYRVNLENLDENERISEMPSLIAKELQEYEQRITKEKCNLNRDFVTSTTSPTSTSAENSSAKLKTITQIKRTATIAEDAALSCSERGKPYARQTKLTECFNKRKMTPTPTTTTTATVTPTAVTATAITVNASNAGTTASSNDLQLLDLPNPIRATLSLCTSSSESALTSTTTPTTANEVESNCDEEAAITTTVTVDSNLSTTPHL